MTTKHWTTGEMCTAGGGKFAPLDPQEEAVQISDIAHALGNICRYNGHTKQYYSVAQHCVIAAQAAEADGFDSETCFAILMHDAAEAYLGDMIRPLKHLPFGAEFQFYEAMLLDVIWKVYDIKVAHDAEVVKAYDEIMLVTEQRDLMPESAMADGPWYNRVPLAPVIQPIYPAQARYQFLSEFNHLCLERYKKGLAA